MYSTQQSLVNVSIRNQAFWAVHPYGCNDVYIANLNVTAPRDEGIDNDDGKWTDPGQGCTSAAAQGLGLNAEC